MCRTVRILIIFCLATALVIIPWNAAFADDGTSAAPVVSPVGNGKIWKSALALVPAESRAMRQVVATSNESKVLVAFIGGGAVIAGAAMAAYGSTSTCKGRFGNSTENCDRLTIIGAATLGAGVATFAVWALSR